MTQSPTTISEARTLLSGHVRDLPGFDQELAIHFLLGWFFDRDGVDGADQFAVALSCYLDSVNRRHVLAEATR